MILRFLPNALAPLVSGIDFTTGILTYWPTLAADAAAPPGITSMLPMFAIIFALFYFLVLRPQRSKDQQFRAMIDNLKEKDRVVTVGGIHGVVTHVQRDAEVVVVRVDEATGAKIRVATSAISRVLVDDDKASKKQVSKNGSS